jgi:hypothetical protein
VLGDVPLLVGVLAVSVSASAPSLSGGSGLGLALLLCLWRHFTGKTFDFVELYDTFKFVMQV